MADLIRWAPTTPDHISSVQASLSAIEEELNNIKSRMEALASENAGATTTQMYESHILLDRTGRQQVETMREHANNTLQSFRVAEEQDTTNAASVRID